MRKWALISAAALIVAIGCQGSRGGAGGTATGGTGGTATGGQSRAVVTLPPTPGLINVAYITGQGRAPGSPTAVIRRVFFSDDLNDDPNDNPDFNVETKLNPERQIGLDAYSLQTIEVNAPIPADRESRAFATFTLEVSKLRVEDSNGGYREYPGQNGQPLLSEAFDLKMRAFRGRHTMLPVFLDDAMLNVDPITDTVVFDRAQFEAINYDPTLNKMVAFISDYVAFDISSLNPVDRPDMSSGSPAERVYFSGDSSAISSAGSSGPFEVLTPTGFIEGTFSGPTPPVNLGTYTLVQLDPRDLSGIAKITSLLGIYREYTSVIGSLGDFEVITFPTSDDDNLQDMVIIQRSGTTIVNLYFGVVDFQAGTFSAWPIRNLDDASISNEITGSVGVFVDKNGASVGTDWPKIRAGQYVFAPGPDLPPSFPTSGRFIVFRT